MPDVTKTPNSKHIFDRKTVRNHRERAGPKIKKYDFLLHESAECLLDRLDDIKLQFPRALDLGARGGLLTGQIQGRGGIEVLVQSDLSWNIIATAPKMSKILKGPEIVPVVLDEELLPFKPNTFDLIISNLSLHWINDLPGTLIQINKALKPNGLFLANLFGGDTLWELRDVLLKAESEIEGGASLRVSPFADVRDLGNLLTRAKFNLTVADTDTISVNYSDIFSLMSDLRGMGETNAAMRRRKSFTRRETIMRAASLYKELYGDGDGRLPATFQIITLTGWAPHNSQPQPLRPGSAQLRLADALGIEERSAGDKAQPN